DCFVSVTALPEDLDKFMEVNPRVPNRTQGGVLSGPVIAGIRETLTDNPEDMAIKNQGIYLLVEDAAFNRAAGGNGQLSITLTHPDKHGIVNGGHTFAAIRDAIEHADEMELKTISRAYVRLHILQGIEGQKVAEIAEGLNRSKQVDDPSLANLQGHFDTIRKVMAGNPGENEIAYHQGGDGDIYIAEILVFLEMFNRERFDRKKHPHYLYNRTKSALEFYQKDLESKPSPLDILVPRLPEILELSDLIQKETPAAARRVGFEFGRMGKGKHRAGAKTNKNIHLPFLDTMMNYRVPKGWLYPMLAAFRANVTWDLRHQKFEWKVPVKKLVNAIIDELVQVCVTEHRDNNLQPDKVGKRESTYVQCYDKLQLYLLESGLD
ncbi:MAG: AIPR family protein, partial [Bryobacteraceae bacterium]